MTLTRIKIDTHFNVSHELENELRHDFGIEGIRLNVLGTRSLDPTTMIALVGAGSTALGALIAGLLRVAEKRNTKKIVIQGKSGRKIEVPADISEEQIKLLVEIAKELDIEKITL